VDILDVSVIYYLLILAGRIRVIMDSVLLFKTDLNVFVKVDILDWNVKPL